MVILKSIVGCARCGGTHADVEARELDRPFAPPEAAPIRWTHWAPCPTNGQPILIAVGSKGVDDGSPTRLHGLPD